MDTRWKNRLAAAALATAIGIGCLVALPAEERGGESLELLLADLIVEESVPEHGGAEDLRAGLLARLARVSEMEARRSVPEGLGAAEGVGYPAQWVPSMRAALEEALEARAFWFEEVESIVGEARRAGMLERGHREMTDGGTLHLTRRGADLLCSRAVVHAARGRPQAAVEDLEAALDLARLADGGLLIDGMIRVGVDGIVLGALATVVEEARGFAPPFRRLVLERFAPEEVLARARRHVSGEARWLMARWQAAPAASRAELASAMNEQAALLRGSLRVLAAPDAATRAGCRGPTKAWQDNLALRWLAHTALALDGRRGLEGAGALDPAALSERLPGDRVLTARVLALFEVSTGTYRTRLCLRSRAEATGGAPSATVWYL